MLITMVTIVMNEATPQRTCINDVCWRGVVLLVSVILEFPYSTVRIPDIFGNQLILRK
jgi:hypothetical protein